MSEPTTTAEMIKLVNSDAMSSWTDEKRKDFTKLFECRAAASRYILHQAGIDILHGAMRRKFISRKHLKGIEEKSLVNESAIEWNERVAVSPQTFAIEWDRATPIYNGIQYTTVGCRPLDELLELANTRAKNILEELPPLKQAVKIIDAKTAKDIDKREALLAEGKKLVERLNELRTPIKMAELDQSMSIGAFRKMVKDVDKKKRSLAERLDEIGTEGAELSDRINKVLYEGLPGLSDAVISVANDHFERARALSATSRRVVEQVQFGDSEAATTMLRTFEKDELEVSERIKAEFSLAMKQLRAAKKAS